MWVGRRAPHEFFDCVVPPTQRLRATGRRTRCPPATGTDPPPSQHRQRRHRHRPRHRAARQVQGLPMRQPRPMLGRLPWFALLRRRRALRFLVFFDIAFEPIVATPSPQRGRSFCVALLRANPVQQLLEGPRVQHTIQWHAHLGSAITAVRLPFQLPGGVRIAVDGEVTAVLDGHLQ